MMRAAKAGNNVLLALKVSRTEIVLEVMIVRNGGARISRSSIVYLDLDSDS